MFSERKIWNDGAPFEDFMGRDEAPPVARRHLAFGGGKGGAGGTTYQQQTTTIPPEVRARYDAVNARAETAAQQPFQPYTGQFVAPLTATQQAGIGQIAAAGQGYQPYQQAATTALTGAAEAALPYYGQAGQNIDAAQAAGAPYTGAATMAGLAGAQAVNPGQLQIGQYMDPYLQSVVAPTMQGLYQQQQQQQSQLMGSQAMRGAFGGDRGSIAAANLARQQGLAAQQAQGGLLSQGYGQALQAAQQQQGVGLQAGQANRAAMQQLSPQLLQIGQQAFQQPMAAAQAQQGLGQGLLGYGQNVAQGLSGLGQQGTQTGLASGQALLGAGTLEQQTQQQLNAALQNQYQQQQGYPFQIAQFLANIAYGGGPLYGSTTSGVTGSPTPFFSDERVKEDITEIGRTHDGQKIIKFKYKGSNQPQIGLSAQDVEKHHPEAVSETPEGIKAVDYDMATKPAERAYGGGLLPSSEGGAVHPSMAGLGFAAGGAPRPAFAGAGAVTPGVDEYSQQLLQSLVNPHAGSLPYGTAGKNMPAGKQQGWSVKPMPAATLLKGTLPPPPPPPKSTGEVVGGGIKDAVGAVETGEKAYKFGEKAYDWARKQAVGEAARPAVPAAGNTPAQPARDATSGVFGYGGKGGASPPAQTSAAPGLGAAAPQQTAEATTGLATPEITTASLGELPTEDLGGLGEGLEGLSMFAARGGRIGYEGGGLVGSNPALPYTGGDDDKSIVEDIADDPQKQNKLDAPKLDMSSGDKGGGQQKKDPATGALKGAASGATAGAMLGPWGALAGGIFGGLSGALARGGRIGYAEGGGQTFVDRLMPAALKASEKTGVHPHLILAQAALESGWGKHAPGNNYFGIKGPGQVLDTKEQGATGLYNTRDSFRKYESPEHSVDDYANFIMSNSRYRPVREARTLDEQIEAMGRSGYATDKDYTAKLRSIANSLSGNATPFTSRERGHETPTAPPQRSAGLAPPLHDVEDMHEGLEPIDTGDDFEMPDRFEMPNRFASGGLVPRHGYQTAGSVPRLDYQTASQEGVPSGVSEEDRQRELQRGLREEPFARPLGLGGLNLPQHQPPMLDPEVRAALDTERMKPSWQGEYDTPGATPPAARAPGVAPPLPPVRNVATVGGNNPPAATPAAATPAGLLPSTPSSVVDAQVDRNRVPADRVLTPESDPDLFDRAGQFIGRNRDWMLAGLSGIGGMLASRSPFLGNAIGEGLVAGASAYPKQQSLAIQQQTADTSSLAQLLRAQDYMQRMADVERGNNNGQISAATASNLAAVQKQIMAFTNMGSPRIAGRRTQEEPQGGQTPVSTAPGDQTRVGTPVSGGSAPPTGTGAAPAFPNTPRTPITVDYTTTESGVPVDKMNNPAHLRAIAEKMSTPEERNRFLEMARVIENTGEVTDITGNRGIVRGWPEMQRQKQAVVSNQAWQRKEADASNERQTIIRSYGLLEKALQQVDTNPAAVATMQIKEAARALNFVVPDGMSSAAAVQEITKQVAARAAQAGSDRARGMLQDGSIEAIKNPEANKQILAQLYADIDAAESRYKYIDGKINITPTGNFSTWQQEWNSANPPNKFQDEAYNRLGVIGATPLDDRGVPDPTRMKVGALYVLKPDEYWRTMNGTVPRDSIRGNVRVKVVEQNGQKGFIVQ